MDTMLTVEEVATILKVQPLTVRQMFREKRLRGFKIGKAWRTTLAMLEEDIAAMSTGVAAPPVTPAVVETSVFVARPPVVVEETPACAAPSPAVVTEVAVSEPVSEEIPVSFEEVLSAPMTTSDIDTDLPDSSEPEESTAFCENTVSPEIDENSLILPEDAVCAGATEGEPSEVIAEIASEASECNESNTLEAPRKRRKAAVPDVPDDQQLLF